MQSQNESSFGSLGLLREAFHEAIEAYEAWQDGEPEPTIESMNGSSVTISAVCGLLWNCGDILPGQRMQQLNDLSRESLQRQTYAAGARFLKALSKERRPH